MALPSAYTAWVTVQTVGDPSGSGLLESAYTAWVTVQTVGDPGATLTASAWSQWQEAFVPVQPVNEWYVAGATAWEVAELVALS